MRSKTLEKYLLNKFELDNIEDINLEEVEELLLNNNDNNGKKLDYDFRDFENFKNLKYISLQNFEIKNFETNELNRCKKISAIQFSNCKFKSKSRLQGNIKVISFNECKNFKIEYLSLLKDLEVLKISNLKKLDMKKAKFAIKNIEKLYLENITICNFKSLSKLKKLKSIQILNCKLNQKVLKVFPKNIRIEV